MGAVGTKHINGINGVVFCGVLNLWGNVLIERGERLKKKKIIIYIPSYCLSYYDPSRLTDMSFQTVKEGIGLAREIVVNGEDPILILSTAYPDLWEKEAEIKKKMALNAGLKDDSIIIIPKVTDSYNEAMRIWEIVKNCLLNRDGDPYFIIVAEKWHAPRAVKALRLFGVNVDEIRKIRTRIERANEPLIKSLRSANIIPYVLWQWLFYLATPYMVKMAIKKQRKAFLTKTG